jgi:hypothetical protein
MAKINAPPISKAIVVSYVPENVEPTSIRQSRISFFFEDSPKRWLGSFSCLHFRCYDNISGYQTIFKIFLRRAFTIFFVEEPRDIAGRQITGVVDNDIARNALVVSFEWANPSGFNAKVGALKDTRVFRLFLANSFQFVSRISESTGEYRNKGGSYTCGYDREYFNDSCLPDSIPDIEKKSAYEIFGNYILYNPDL